MRQLEIPKSCVQDAMRFTKSHVRVCVHGIFSFWGSCPRNALPIPPAHFVRSPRGIQAFEKARSNEKKKVFGSLSGYREAIRLREWWASNWISVGLLQKHRSWTNITHTILHTTWPTRPDRDWAISLSQGSSNRTVWSQDQSSSLKGENNPHSESDIIVQSRRTTAATAHGFSKGSWVFWSYLAYRCPIAVWATCLTCWWVLMMPMCSLLTGPSPLGPFRFHRISSPMSYGMMVLLFIGMLFFCQNLLRSQPPLSLLGGWMQRRLCTALLSMFSALGSHFLWQVWDDGLRQQDAPIKTCQATITHSTSCRTDSKNTNHKFMMYLLKVPRCLVVFDNTQWCTHNGHIPVLASLSQVDSSHGTSESDSEAMSYCL